MAASRDQSEALVRLGKGHKVRCDQVTTCISETHTCVTQRVTPPRNVWHHQTSTNSTMQSVLGECSRQIKARAMMFCTNLKKTPWKVVDTMSFRNLVKHHRESYFELRLKPWANNLGARCGERCTELVFGSSKFSSSIRIQVNSSEIFHHHCGRKQQNVSHTLQGELSYRR